jgi:hypothetical protein
MVSPRNCAAVLRGARGPPLPWAPTALGAVPVGVAFRPVRSLFCIPCMVTDHTIVATRGAAGHSGRVRGESETRCVGENNPPGAPLQVFAGLGAFVGVDATYCDDLGAGPSRGQRS